MDAVCFNVGVQSKDLRGKHLQDLIYRSPSDTEEGQKIPQTSPDFDIPTRMNSTPPSRVLPPRTQSRHGCTLSPACALRVCAHTSASVHGLPSTAQLATAPARSHSRTRSHVRGHVRGHACACPPPSLAAKTAPPMPHYPHPSSTPTPTAATHPYQFCAHAQDYLSRLPHALKPPMRQELHTIWELWSAADPHLSTDYRGGESLRFRHPGVRGRRERDQVHAEHLREGGRKLPDRRARGQVRSVLADAQAVWHPHQSTRRLPGVPGGLHCNAPHPLPLSPTSSAPLPLPIPILPSKT